MNPELVKYIGYLASVFIVLSFIVRSISLIRLINLLGCICFVIYGAFSKEILWPVIIPNTVICLVQVYYLWIKK